MRDGNKAQITSSVAKISDALKSKQGVGIRYYASHGLQLDWRNYMVPVDANLKSAADVARQIIDLSSVVDIFKAAGSRMNIVVLDACGAVVVTTQSIYSTASTNALCSELSKNHVILAICLGSVKYPG